MTTTILITGSTDGIGFEAAKRLALGGHHLILHGRNPAKLDHSVAELEKLGGVGKVEAVVADLSRPVDVAAFADRIATQFESLDVLINNAGVFQTPDPITVDDLDLRFAVNTIAPYVLTRRLLPLMPTTGRVINLSSAAQAPVDPAALEGTVRMPAGEAYAQSKLALTMWSRHLADELGEAGPAIVAVNPGSLLATKMVKEGYGIAGNDIGIGADVLERAALSDEFASASGSYYDNDARRFAPPHPDALDTRKNEALTQHIEAIIERLT